MTWPCFLKGQPSRDDHFLGPHLRMFLAEVKNSLNHRSSTRHRPIGAYRVFGMVSGRNIHHLTNAAYVADAKISWRLALLVKKLELEERICLGICLGVGLIGYEHSKDEYEDRAPICRERRKRAEDFVRAQSQFRAADVGGRAA